MKKHSSKFPFFLIICSCFCLSNAFAERIKQIRVVGNVRIDTETILFEIPNKKGDTIDSSTCNDILKVLNKTGYFEDIKVTLKDGDSVEINVVENPVINKIAYEGMKSNIRDAMNDIVKLKSRQVLNTAVIKETQQIILEIYRRHGFLSAKVTPKIVKLSDNRVDLVFEIKQGSHAYVRKIAFIGNESFRSKEIKEFLKIKEKSWYHISIFNGTVNKVYDPERFEEDKQQIIKFYTSQGYADVEIVSATAELSLDKRDFFITYYINEGGIYKLGKVSVESKISKLNDNLLNAVVMAKEGQIFSSHMIEYCINILKNVAKAGGYNFAVVKPVLIKNKSKKTVDIKFVISDGPKVFIERVNINGNRHTRDFVIRRDLCFDEGDSFDHNIIKQNEEHLKQSPFFKNVRMDIEQGTLYEESVIINVEVEEQKTGNVVFNFGYSTSDKFTTKFSINDPNFRGKAQDLGFEVEYAKRQLTGEISFTEPRLFGKALNGSCGVFISRSKQYEGIKQIIAGVNFGLAYKLAPHWIQHWNYKLQRENLIYKYLVRDSIKDRILLNDVKNNEEIDFKKCVILEELSDAGVNWASSVGHTITYDRRNRHVLPSKGYKVAWAVTFTGLGGTLFHIKNRLTASWHQKLHKDLILNLRGSIAHIKGLGSKDLRVVDALRLGGEDLRGFDFYGVSPVRGIPKIQACEDINEKIEVFKKEHKDDYERINKKFNSEFEALTKNIVSMTENEVAEAVEKININRFEEIIKIDDMFALNREQMANYSKLEESAKHNKGRQVGATLAWTGSVDLTFPMPLLPRDAEVLGTFFMDTGSAWHSKREIKNTIDSVINDKHFMRVSVGTCLAWQSPFGLLSIGYAWPVRKGEHDKLQKFILGYGFNY